MTFQIPDINLETRGICNDSVMACFGEQLQNSTAPQLNILKFYYEEWSEEYMPHLSSRDTIRCPQQNHSKQNILEFLKKFKEFLDKKNKEN
ncbi:hypothetical protein scyTo_0009189 [Scyliorhinus torazame]|uniref:Uncharacterized protein n=1 Tax=Scyliorhinus torazame TaxID=75743 RepID=A0A401NI25_SCYTO|nr:hypothetical protein [Scyliorhinus torazame]